MISDELRTPTWGAVNTENTCSLAYFSIQRSSNPRSHNSVMGATVPCLSPARELEAKTETWNSGFVGGLKSLSRVHENLELNNLAYYMIGIETETSDEDSESSVQTCPAIHQPCSTAKQDIRNLEPWAMWNLSACASSTSLFHGVMTASYLEATTLHQ
jgi:hypothetical protein